METHETICRLCLKICESFNAIEGDMKDVLDKLLPKIDLTVVREPVVCTSCADMLKKCFDFKATCLYTHDNIDSFVSHNKDNVNLDLKEDQDVCEFCIGSVKNCSAISLNVKKGDVILEKMIEQCFPELDLTIMKKPVICAPCHTSLEEFFHFVINCLTVEEKIKKYCETLGVNSKGRVELTNLLRFIINEGNDSIGVIKVEKQLCEEREIDNGGDSFNHMDDSEIAEEKADEYKIESFMYLDMKLNEEQFIPKNILGCKEESNNFEVVKIEETFCGGAELKKENPVEVEDQNFLVNGEIEVKIDEPDFIRLEDSDILPQPEVRKVAMYKCEYCSHQTKRKHDMKRHLLKHKDPSEVTMHKCNSCSFQTKHKDTIKMHLLTHMDPSEVAMYKCDSCSYQTVYKNVLKRHLLTHKNPSEVTMYKCDSCLYQTKVKYELKRHLLIHKDPSEVTMYKCNSCLYQANNKIKLKSHLLTHQNPSEVTMYKCDSCLYQTKHKGNLKGHFLKHKHPSQVTLYKCDSCPYQTEYKVNINRHVLIHKNPSEITMYKCDFCSYQTKHKRNLKHHLLSHKDTSEVTMYKCEYCLYESKYQCTLKRHMLRRHKKSFRSNNVQM